MTSSIGARPCRATSIRRCRPLQPRCRRARASPSRDRHSIPRWATLPADMYFDQFKHQLPDIDERETDEWLSSLDQVVEQEGEVRARFLIYKLLKRARQLQIGLPPLTQTRYINTISPEQEPDFPGDEAMELRIRRIVRWNAVAMVLRANNRFPGIGGHLSTYASSASLYEVGFNHFFRGKDGDGEWRPDLLPGPRRARHLRPGVPRRSPDRGPARPLPTRDRPRARGSQLVPASAADARVLGVPRRSRWASDRSRPSTRPGSTATCTTGACSTRRIRGSGRSSATARPTSPRPSARSMSRRARASTT